MPNKDTNPHFSHPLSYSQHSLFLECARKYYFSYKEKLIPKISNKSAMDFGSLIHQVLNKLFIEKSLSKALSYLESLPFEIDSPKYTRELAILCINEYYFMNSDFVEQFDIIAAEQKETFLINKIPVTIIIDLIGSYNNDVIIVDFKTSSTKKFDMNMSSQADFYFKAAHEIYKVSPVYLLYQVIITTKTPKYETYRAYRNSFNLSEFDKDFESFTASIIRNDYPRNTTNCTKYFRNCEFASICSGFDENDIAFKKSELFNIKP